MGTRESQVFLPAKCVGSPMVIRPDCWTQKDHQNGVWIWDHSILHALDSLARGLLNDFPPSLLRNLT